MNLTRRSYIVAGVTTAVGIAGQWVSGLWSGSWLLLALPWVGGLTWEGLAMRRNPLTIERRSRQPLRLGREERGYAHWHNRSGRRVQATIEMPYPRECADLAAAQTITLEPHGDRELAFSIMARDLGELHWPPVYSLIVGPLGLAAWRHTAPAPMTASVEPDTLTANTSRWGLGRSGHKRSNRLGSSTGELEDLRGYRPGDPLRHIDWKATARRGEPVVKVFAEDQQLDIMIVVDAGRRARLDAGSLTRLGHYVNVSAQIAERAAASGDRVGTVVFADRILGQVPPGQGQGQVRQIRQLLAGTRAAARESNPVVAALTVRRLLGQRGLVIYLSDLEESEAAGQLIEATRLLAPKHLPVIGSLEDPTERRLRRAPPTTWLAPYRRLAALELARERRLTARRVTAWGARVVTAWPENLTTDLLATYDQLRQRRAV